MEINQELLINLVKERPVLWDKTMDEYKNKLLTYEAWREVYKNLKPSFDTLEADQKQEFGTSVMKKWANIRDSWMKYYKKINECKTDSGSRSIRKYVFYEQMLFLRKIADVFPTAESNDSDSVSNDNASSRCSEKRKNKTHSQCQKDKRLSTSREYTHTYNHLEEHSRALNFFKSIAPSVDSFTDDEIIDFQSQVLDIIKTIRQRRYPERHYNTWGAHNHYQGSGEVANSNTYSHREYLDQSPRPPSPEPSKEDLIRFKCFMRKLCDSPSGGRLEPDISFSESNDTAYSTVDVNDVKY